MYGYIYETTNLINGKKYIGQHVSKTFDEDYYGSGKVFLNALRKNGKENFKVEILEWCKTDKELGEAEYRHIKEADAVNSPNYYNIVPGGDHRSVTGMIFIHKPGATKGKKIWPEELDKYTSEGWVKGRVPRDPKAVAKTAESNRGKKYKHSENFINNGAKNKGKPLSESHKKSLRGKKLGRHWISNLELEISKMVPNKDVEKYLNEGWIRGRIEYMK